MTKPSGQERPVLTLRELNRASNGTRSLREAHAQADATATEL